MNNASKIRDIGMRDGRFIRALRLDKAGDVHPGERHYFDHDSVVTLGTVQVDAHDPDGSTRTSLHTAGTPSDTITILARRWHEITAVGGPAEWECRFEAEQSSYGVPQSRPEVSA